MPDLALKQCLDRLCELVPEVFYKSGNYRVRQDLNTIKAKEFCSKAEWDRIVRDALEDFCDLKGWDVMAHSSFNERAERIYEASVEIWRSGRMVNNYPSVADSRVFALAQAVVTALEAE
jgi:hypothetical protein